MKEPRGLDGIYIRWEVEPGKWDAVCLSDIEPKEKLEEFLTGKSPTWLVGAVVHLAEKLREVGDKFDITTEEK